MEFVIANLKSGIRYANEDGEPYIVAPITLMRVGVLNGSEGPIYYPAHEIQASVDAWNNDVPLLLDHPKNGTDYDVLVKSQLGWVRNARFDKGYLKAEGWFLVNRTREISDKIYRALRSGKKIEVSTGLKITPEHTRGVDIDGTEYQLVARNHRPDHLAILVGQVGACSIAQKCGVNNEQALMVANCTCGAASKGDQEDLLGVPDNWDFSDPSDTSVRERKEVVGVHNGSWFCNCNPETQLAHNREAESELLTVDAEWDFSEGSKGLY